MISLSAFQDFFRSLLDGRQFFGGEACGNNFCEQRGKFCLFGVHRGYAPFGIVLILYCTHAGEISAVLSNFRIYCLNYTTQRGNVNPPNMSVYYSLVWGGTDIHVG